jgi:transposase
MNYLEFIKTLKAKKINTSLLVATIDFGKNTHYGYFRIFHGEDVKPFRFSNDRDGFKKFWRKLCLFRDKHELDTVVVGFESTGSYGIPFIHFLREKPVFLVQVNPMHTKKVKELEGNSPNKTDKKDPRVIADIVCLGHVLSVIVPEGSAAELRTLIHAREEAMRRRTSFFNKIHALLSRIFPELQRVMKSNKSKTLLYLMGNYPLPSMIVSLGVNELTKILQKISRGKLGKQRAEQLFEAAKSSIGITEGTESMVMQLRYFLRAIEHENIYISQLEKKMKSYLDEIPYSHYLLSIKGIGVIITAGLIGEVGDFRKFKTSSEIMKLAGYNLYEISSGEHQGQRRISKRGRHLLRKVLFLAALNVLRSGGILHEKYQSYLHRNMPKPKAIIAISRKLITIIFALIRDQRDYEIDYSEKPRLRRAA